MKKYISIVLSVILIFSSWCVFAENEDEASMSIEVFPITVENAEQQGTVDEMDLSEPEGNIQLNEDFLTENNEIELYDMNSQSGDSWSETGALLAGRADFDTVVSNGSLYAIGGYGSSGYTYSIEKYDDSTASWVEVTSIPNEVNGFSVVGVANNIYIIGGYIDNTYLNDVQIYNTSTGTWTTGTPMLERRDSAASLYADNKIYVFGGRNANGFVNSYEYYDITNNIWNKVTSGYDESIIRIGAKGKYANGYVCLSGGYNQQYEKMGVNLYLASDMTNTTQMLNKGEEYISVAWGIDKALIFSASTDSSTYTIKEMTVEENNPYVTTVTMDGYPINAKYTQNAIYNGYLYCMGGYVSSSKSYNASVYKYSVNYGDFVTGDGQISSIVTSDGNTITLNVEAGKDYYFMVNVKNMSTFDGYTFTIEYPEDSFNIMDACAMTDNLEISTSNSNINDTDIRITQKSSTGISFTCSETVPNGKKVTETINAVHLRANSSGQRSITYRMTK